MNEGTLPTGTLLRVKDTSTISLADIEDQYSDVRPENKSINMLIVDHWWCPATHQKTDYVVLFEGTRAILCTASAKNNDNVEVVGKINELN